MRNFSISFTMNQRLVSTHNKPAQSLICALATRVLSTSDFVLASSRISVTKRNRTKTRSTSYSVTSVNSYSNVNARNVKRSRPCCGNRLHDVTKRVFSFLLVLCMCVYFYIFYNSFTCIFGILLGDSKNCQNKHLRSNIVRCKCLTSRATRSMKSNVIVSNEK